MHPPNRLSNLSTVLEFLCNHLFPSLPPSHSSNFPQSLCRPITSSILANLLVPSLPSSFSSLPPFLDLLRKAVAFEEDYVVQALGNSPNDKPVKAWADGVGGHYERKRRVDILELVRSVIVDRKDEGTFTIEVEVLGHEDNAVNPVPKAENNKDGNAWGFDDSEDEPATFPQQTQEDAGNIM